jgi:hypothetical protein
MVSKETYYKTIIASLPNENSVAEFLNKPEILAKWNDEDREYFIVRYLMDHGWTETLNEDEIDIDPEEPDSI